MVKRKSYFSPPSTEKDKSARQVSPIGLSVDPRLLDCTPDSSFTPMSSNANTQPPTIMSTPPGVPRPMLPASLPTRPAFSGSPMDPARFAGLAESDKLNHIYAQNAALLQNQTYMQELLLRMVTNQEGAIQAMNQQIRLQQQSMALFQNQISAMNPLHIASLFMEMQDDREERESKKENLVLYGFAEKLPDNQSDLDVIKAAFTAAGADPEVVTSVDRLGQPRDANSKPRPLKIFTSSLAEKTKVLKGQKAVFKMVPDLATRTDKPFFRHDQTRLQRQADYQLRQQLKDVSEKNPGIKFKIRGSEIVSENVSAPMQVA